MLQAMSVSGDTGIINFGQKVFRKNRQTVDASLPLSGNKESITVQTASQITEKIQDKKNEVEHYFDCSFWGQYTKFDLIRFAFYCQVEASVGGSWNSTWLINNWDSIKNAASAITDSMP